MEIFSNGNGMELSILFSIDQIPSQFAVQDNGMIAGDESLADAKIGARRTLGDDHALILVENVQVPDTAQQFKHLADDWEAHLVILAQVHHRIGLVNGREDQENQEIIREPVLPQVGEVELDQRPACWFRHLGRLKRFLALVGFVVKP